MVKDQRIIFISCGQYAEHEKALGDRVAELVRELTDCEPFFAEQQHDLAGVTENILNALSRSVAFIAIMHPRGDVSFANVPQNKTRGSVWIEQEIAIAAFITQALARPLPVRVYVHERIALEGLREKLHLNPQRFSREEEVIEDLGGFLPDWKSLGSQARGVGLRLQAKFSHEKEQPTNWGTMYVLRVSVRNTGSEAARDFLLDVWFPELFLRSAPSTAGLGVSDSQKPGYRRFRVESSIRRITVLHRGDETGVLLSIPYQIEDKTVSLDHELLKMCVIAQVRSGNMEPQITEQPIEQLRDLV